jgi:6-pyruvoyl-tetrahydropterin synthase
VTDRPRCSLTRAIALHARHRYPHGEPREEHGHLYRIEVTVCAALDAARSAVVDLAGLDAILAQHVTQPLAGSNLNAAIPEFASGAWSPTCEALAAWCWRTMVDRLPPGVALERVRVAEDATLWADCSGVA